MNDFLTNKPTDSVNMLSANSLVRLLARIYIPVQFISPSLSFYNFIQPLSRVNQLKMYKYAIGISGPPLWSSGQSSWLQIRRPGFDSRHYQKKK
jgi:hypothetical protein